MNGHTGAVTLAASDVNAIPVGGSITQSQVTGLPAALAALPITYATISAVNALPTYATLQNWLASSGAKRADYVATTAVPSLSGQQTVDGVLIPVGATVLVTAQASSIVNGLWICSSSTWTRPTDYASTYYVAQGALVVVANRTGGSNGVTHNETIWQQVDAGGIIDTNATNWCSPAMSIPRLPPSRATASRLPAPPSQPRWPPVRACRSPPLTLGSTGPPPRSGSLGVSSRRSTACCSHPQPRPILSRR